MRIKSIFIYRVDYDGVAVKNGRIAQFRFTEFSVGIKRAIECIESIRLGISINDEGCFDPVRFGVIIEGDTEIYTPSGKDDLGLIADLLQRGNIEL